MKTGAKHMALFRRARIQTRLLAIFLFLSLVPVLFIGVYAYSVYTGSINAKVRDSAIQNIELLNATLNTELERYAFYINSLSVLDAVQDALVGARQGVFSVNSEEVRLIRKMVADTTMQPIFMRNIRIAARDGSVVYDYGYDDVSDAQYRDVLRRVEAASPNDALSYVRTYRSVDNLVLGRKIYRYPSAEEHIGYILVYINERMLGESIYPSLSFAQGSQLLLVSGDGRALSAARREDIGQSLTDTRLFVDLKAAHGRGETSFDTISAGGEALAVYAYNRRYDCFFVLTVPRAYIEGETRHITRSLIGLAALLIALCLGAAALVYRSIMQPIRLITARCGLIARRGEDRPIGDESPDELGYLARAVDGMIADLEAYALARQQDQLRKRELELEMLRYQINPHFLFNTLNTLKWVAVMNEETVLAEGISSLSALLHSTLMQPSELITVAAEIDNLKHYFSIQRIRYADSFEATYDLDEALLSCKIPRFILQPIAENSVIHGTGEVGRKIHITVSCRARADGGALLSVEDDGVGFDVDQAARQKKERFSGIGVKNVDERLRLYFGKNWGLTLTSKPGAGTKCEIVIPPHWLKEGGKRDD